VVTYLSLEDVLYIHNEQIRLFGGATGVRDHGLIESALLRPQTGYYDGIVEQTAALWESLAMNHGFIDGNKRVAFASVDIFLELNGFELMADPEDVILFIYRHLEANSFTKEVLHSWLNDVVQAQKI
jgi:death-on-curing protein